MLKLNYVGDLEEINDELINSKLSFTDDMIDKIVTIELTINNHDIYHLRGRVLKDYGFNLTIVEFRGFTEGGS